MRPLCRLLPLVCLTLLAFTASYAGEKGKNLYPTPELLIATRDHNPNSVAAVIQRMGSVDGQDKMSRLSYVKLNPGVRLDTAIAKLRADSRVEIVLPASAKSVDMNDLRSVKAHNEYLHAIEELTDKDPGDYFDAREYYLSDRVSADGRYHPEVYAKAREQADSMLIASHPGAGATGVQIKPMVLSGKWSYMGPSNRAVAYQQYNGVPPVSGRVNGIAVSPSDSNVIYVATSGGGVWKTTDGGLLWNPLSDNWKFLQTSCVTLDPKNPQIVYVGTGDYPGGIGNANGIMKSTDGGATWTNYGGVFGNASVAKILIDPSQTTHLIALTSQFVWRSTDGGVTWNPSKATNGTTLPKGFWSGGSISAPDSGGHRIYYIVSDVQFQNVWRSTNGGISWSVMPFPAILPTKSHSLDVTASERKTGLGPTTVYVLNCIDQAVWRSKDGGNTWAGIGGGIPQDTQNGASVNWGQSDYDYYIGTIENAKTAGDCLFVGLVTLSSTANAEGNADWNDLSKGDQGGALMHTDQHAFCRDPNSRNRIFFGGDGGIFRCDYDPASNSGNFVSWSGNLGNTTFWSIAIDPTNKDLALGGTQDTGTALSTGNLLMWQNPTGGDGGFSLINPFFPEIEFSSVQFGKIFRTGDHWNGQNDISTGGGFGSGKNQNFNGEPCAFITPLALGKIGYPLYAGSNMLWGYHNGNWTPDLGNKILSSSGVIKAIATCPTNLDVVYTGSSDGELWKTTDAGAHWKRFFGVTGQPITWICASPNTSADVLVSYGGVGSRLYQCQNTLAASPQWIDRSGDAGISPLPQGPVHAVVRDPYDPDHTWYVGTDVGVFMTSNAGVTWLNMSNAYGLPNVIVQDLKVSPLGYLYAGTFGRGLWRIKLLSLALNSVGAPSTIMGGITGNGSVNLTGFANAGGATVHLQSNNSAAASVPASVVVPEGAATASFPINTIPVLLDTNVTITGTMNGVVKTRDIVVKAPTLDSTSIVPNTIIGGSPVFGGVFLTGVTPIDRQVTLQSNSALVQVPASVTIKGGTSSSNYKATTSTVMANTNVTITAKYINTRTATVTLTGGGLLSITTIPAQFVGGKTRPFTVNMTGNEPFDVVVHLGGGSGIVTPPSSVTVLNGKNSATFNQATPAVSAPTPVTLTATLDSVTKSVNFTLLPPPQVYHVGLNPSTVMAGFSTLCTVTLTQAADPGGVTVNVYTSNASLVPVPATVLVPAGKASVSFTLNTNRTLTQTTVKISASVGVVRSAPYAILTLTPSG